MKITVEHKELQITGTIVNFLSQTVKKPPEKPSLTGEKEEVLLTLAVVCWDDPGQSIQICPLEQLSWLDISSDLEELAEIIEDDESEDSQDLQQ